MRLFIAVDLDEPLRERVRRLSSELRQVAGNGVKATWVTPDRLHLTIHFIGEVGEDVVPAVAAALAAPIEVPPFDLEIGGMGLFPSPARPRVVWAGLRAGVPELGRMHALIGARLTALGLRLDARPFAPHLTLARVKGHVSSRLADAVGRCAGAAVGRCRVEAATLYRSVLGEGGPTYIVLARAPLAGTA